MGIRNLVLVDVNLKKKKKGLWYMYVPNWNSIVIEAEIESDFSHLGHFPLDVANILRTSCH